MTFSLIAAYAVALGMSGLAVFQLGDAPAMREGYAASVSPDARRDHVQRALLLKVVRYKGGATLQSGVDSTGASHTLEDIYDSVNVNITQDLSAVRPYPFANQLITEAELHSLTLEPQPSGPGWNATMFLLRRGTRLGDLGALIEKGSRDRLAVFSDALAGDPSRILRTAAHELGHALNLFHNDGDASAACCRGAGTPQDGITLMNSEKCLDRTAWRLGFGAREQEHFLNHPMSNIQPNSGVAFGTCILDHLQEC